MNTLIILMSLLAIPVFSQETGLNFPGSAAVSSPIGFLFANPQNSGLPIWGPGDRGVTYIWRAYPRQQHGYYTTFFWGNNGDFGWGGLKYYGFHPYPQGDGNSHAWEIAGGGGGDILGGAVACDQWYIQVARVWGNGSTKYHEYYWDWPNTSRVVTFQYNEDRSDPPSPVLYWADAPWPWGCCCVYGECGNTAEVYNGVLRGIQIYNNKLSDADITAEISSPLSTTAGSSYIWYLNINPTPTDISDHSGQGHNFSWAGSARPSLWTSGTVPTDTIAPAAITNLAASSGTYNGQINLTWTATGDDGSSGTASTYDLRYATATITSGNFSSAQQVSGEPTPGASGTAQAFTVTGLTPGTTYYFAIKASDGTNWSAVSNSPSATAQENGVIPTFDAKINFQPSGNSGSTPSGYLADEGRAYGDRGNGYSYGWAADNTAATRDRGAPADYRYATLCHMTNSWEIEVPAGDYRVNIVAGDNDNIDSHYLIDIEGITVIDAVPTAQEHFFEGEDTITVSDGRLTVSNNAGASNNKVCYIEIASLTSAATGFHSSTSESVSPLPAIEAEPNPFNAVIKIAGSGQWAAGRQGIVFNIYNIHGKLVQALHAASCQLPAGITWDASGMPSGIYIVRAYAGTQMLTKQITLMK